MPNTPSRDKRLVSLSEAAHYLAVTPRTVQNLVTKGVLHPVRIPGLRRTLIERDELDELVKCGVESPEKAEP